MKKIISIFIAVLLLFCITNPSGIVFAAKLSDNIIIQLTETHTESQIDINVKLVTNSGISAMTLELAYNKNVFEYVGYEKGNALSNLDLMSTDLSNDQTLPVKFNWFNQNLGNVENDSSTGNILQLHFTLKQDCSSGSYEIGFKYNEGDIVYIENGNANTKSAIISKAVVNIAKNKIIETEIVEDTPNKTSPVLIVGIVLGSIAIVALTFLLVIRIKKEKLRKKNWLEI